MRYSNRVVRCTDSVRNLSAVGINDRTTGTNAEGTVSPVVVLDSISTKIKSNRKDVVWKRDEKMGMLPRVGVHVHVYM